MCFFYKKKHKHLTRLCLLDSLLLSLLELLGSLFLFPLALLSRAQLANTFFLGLLSIGLLFGEFLSTLFGVDLGILLENFFAVLAKLVLDLFRASQST